MAFATCDMELVCQAQTRCYWRRRICAPGKGSLPDNSRHASLSRLSAAHRLAHARTLALLGLTAAVRPSLRGGG